MSLGAWEGELLLQIWLEHVAKVWAASTKHVSSSAAVGSAVGAPGLAQPFSRAHSSAPLCQPGSEIQTEPLKMFLVFSRKDHRCI